MSNWQQARYERDARVAAGRAFAKHKMVDTRDVVALLEAVIRPGDRVWLHVAGLNSLVMEFSSLQASRRALA
jgi:hypothetical protein